MTGSALARGILLQVTSLVTRLGLGDYRFLGRRKMHYGKSDSQCLQELEVMISQFLVFQRLISRFQYKGQGYTVTILYISHHIA